MTAHHHHGDSHSHAQSDPHDPRYRRILWIALAINAVMFVVEVTASFIANSASLLADAVDFAGDAANYGLSIWALSMAVTWRSRTAMIKGISMLLFGTFVLVKAIWLWLSGAVPQAELMGGIGVLALCANVSVTVMLYAWRAGDANMRSVWLCSRNDAISNIAVIVAAVIVWLTGHGFADILVALLMGVLAIHSGAAVIRLARRELRAAAIQ